jgi:hypothetical protein
MLPSSSRGRHNLRTFLLRARADDRRGRDGAEIMERRDLADRVEVLELKVTALEELPARVSSLEAKIVQLRTEMMGEFSAVRRDIRSVEENLRGDIRSVEENLRREMRSLEGNLRQEMRALNEQTLAQVRVLHEEVIDRIGKLDEGRRHSRKR